MSIFGDVGFFEGFAAGGLFRSLIILTAAGNPLPHVKVGALKKQIPCLTVRRSSIGDNQDLKRRTGHS